MIFMVQFLVNVVALSWMIFLINILTSLVSTGFRVYLFIQRFVQSLRIWNPHVLAVLRVQSKVKEVRRACSEVPYDLEIPDAYSQ